MSSELIVGQGVRRAFEEWAKQFKIELAGDGSTTAVGIAQKKLLDAFRRQFGAVEDFVTTRTVTTNSEGELDPVVIQKIANEVPSVPGHAGVDGTGVEFIFAVTNFSPIPLFGYPDNTWGYDTGGTSAIVTWTDSASDVTLLEPYLWAASRTVQGDVTGTPTLGVWSTPSLIGRYAPDGTPGVDGEGVEYVYSRGFGDTVPETEWPDSRWLIGRTGTVGGRIWTSDAPGLRLSDPVLHRSQRPTTGRQTTSRGRWSAPVIVGRFGRPGEDGTDGVGYEFVFSIGNTDVVPANQLPSNAWTFDSPVAVAGRAWTDGAPAMTVAAPTLHRSERTITGSSTVTGNWSVPIIVARLAVDGADGDDGAGLEYVFSQGAVETVPTGELPSNTWVFDAGGVSGVRAWTDDAPSLTVGKPVLHRSQRTITGSGTVTGQWTVPAIVGRRGDGLAGQPFIVSELAPLNPAIGDLWYQNPGDLKTRIWGASVRFYLYPIRGTTLYAYTSSGTKISGGDIQLASRSSGLAFSSQYIYYAGTKTVGTARKPHIFVNSVTGTRVPTLDFQLHDGNTGLQGIAVTSKRLYTIGVTRLSTSTPGRYDNRTLIYEYSLEPATYGDLIETGQVEGDNLTANVQRYHGITVSETHNQIYLARTHSAGNWDGWIRRLNLRTPDATNTSTLQIHLSPSSQGRQKVLSGGSGTIVTNKTYEGLELSGGYIYGVRNSAGRSFVEAYTADLASADTSKNWNTPQIGSSSDALEAASTGWSVYIEPPAD